MVEHTSLAEEISSEIQISIPQLAKSFTKYRSECRALSRKMKKNELVRSFAARPSETQMRCAGLSSRSRSITDGPLCIYGVSAVAQTLEVKGAAVMAQSEDALFKVHAIGRAARNRRMMWRRQEIGIELLIRGFNEPHDLILADMPLILSRRFATRLDNPHLDTEWKSLLRSYSVLWEKAFQRIHPFRKQGPVVAFLRNEISYGFVQQLLKNVDITARSTSMMIDLSYVLHDLLEPRTRTTLLEVDMSEMSGIKAVDTEQSPRSSVLFLKTAISNSAIQVELPGAPDEWDEKVVNNLCSSISSLTLPSLSTNLPMPIWLAKEKAMFSKEVLQYVARRVKRKMEV